MFSPRRSMVAVTGGSARRALRVAAVGGVLVALAGCGGGGGSDASASTTAADAKPKGCREVPYTVDLGVGAGSATQPFEVTDAIAQRVSVLPGEMAFDAPQMSALTSKAEVSPIGQYTIYVSDGEIAADALPGTDDGTVADGSATVGVVRILPAGEGGFTEGEVVAPSSELAYETRSEQVPVSAAIVPERNTGGMELTGEVEGTVTVLEVGEEDICVEVDLTIAGEQGGAIKGTILAPVERAGNSFFVT